VGDPVLSQAYADEVLSVGRAAGLHRVGIASAEPFDQARRALDERAAAGLSATMAFTYRNPARSSRARRAWSNGSAEAMPTRCSPAARPTESTSSA